MRKTLSVTGMILLVGKKSGDNLLVVLPANLKVDTKSIKEQVNEAVEMEKPEKILEKFGIEVGGVPPFGGILGIPVYVDKKILVDSNKEEIIVIFDDEEIDQFVVDERAVAVEGQSLYPRFYKSGEGEPGGGWSAYSERAYNRLGFFPSEP